MLAIGLDAASQRSKFGFAIAEANERGLRVLEAGLLGTSDTTADPMSTLVRIIDGSPAGLIAIDAPLGWPANLGSGLMGHRAGEKIATAKDELFRRATDRALWRTRRGRPLEIGADRIARAAHEALSVLNELRSRSNEELPLAWELPVQRWSVIEVYPAATLAAHGARSTGYKKPDQLAQRREIAQQLADVMPGLGEWETGSADAFDACLCLLCAWDFLKGAAVGPAPEERELAQKEGWIWVRERNQD